MYEGGLRVPMGVQWPGHIAPGTVSHLPSIHMDLMPTICQVAGAVPPNTIDGVSLLGAMTGSAPEPAFATRPLFFLRREGGRNYDGLTIHAVRRGNWKLTINLPMRPMELFNLSDDPLETTDLADSRPKIREELIYLIQCQIQRGGAVPWQKPEMALPTGGEGK